MTICKKNELLFNNIPINTLFLFCFYSQLNARHLNAKSNLTETASSRIQALNWADHKLYKHFHRKFSLIVKAFGSEKMSQEVIELRNRTNEWFDYCVGNSELPLKAKKSIIKQNGNTTCWLLTVEELDFTEFLRIRQMKLFPGSVPIAPTLQPKHKLMIKRQPFNKYIRSKLAFIDPKHNVFTCKGCLKRVSEMKPQTTTIDPSYELAIALQKISNKSL